VQAPAIEKELGDGTTRLHDAQIVVTADAELVPYLVGDHLLVAMRAGSRFSIGAVVDGLGKHERPIGSRSRTQQYTAIKDRIPVVEWRALKTGLNVRDPVALVAYVVTPSQKLLLYRLLVPAHIATEPRFLCVWERRATDANVGMGKDVGRRIGPESGSGRQ